MESIYVDGGMNKQTGEYAYASVVDNNGQDLIEKYSFLFTDFQLRSVDLKYERRTIILCYCPGVKQQNNLAELIAAICGLRIAIYENIDIVYSDSSLIVDYWSKRIKTKDRERLTIYKYMLINNLIKLSKSFNGKLIKISGNNNLADLGYHKS